MKIICDLPKPVGIGRDAAAPKAVCVFFERELTDDEMRFLHDLLNDRIAVSSAPEPIRH